MQPTAVQSKSPVQVPPELQGLVREISSLVNVKGNQQVNIELNSNVLKGLHIQIERQKDGAIAIQFQSSSEAVTQLLSRNVDALSQGLIDRGVNVGDIPRLRLTPRPERKVQVKVQRLVPISAAPIPRRTPGRQAVGAHTLPLESRLRPLSYRFENLPTDAAAGSSWNWYRASALMKPVDVVGCYFKTA
jgi:hypothetical protein